MAVVEELIRKESDGTISFGNYELGEKAKKSDFEYNGDTYKIKTFKEITKLERNEMFVYESVPGTAVEKFSNSNEEIKFFVEGFEDAQITLELEAETEYDITVNGKDAGTMKTNLGGKLSLSVELDPKSRVEVSIKKK
ncbi:MAG: endosialidase [Lachnospiraceae bacterium]|jgi:hypothetical protein|nr:endosialidase [Lachnospiraceae bacterium]MDD6148956.1 endosialidase [Lachnospiraceae bacterium]MDY5703996.1 endosialidase [Lachnospiraceae bacterium]